MADMIVADDEHSFVNSIKEDGNHYIIYQKVVYVQDTFLILSCLSVSWSQSQPSTRDVGLGEILTLDLGPHKIIFLFPVPARITFGERIKKNFTFYFIEFDVFVTTINYFLVKAEPFCPLFQSKYVSIRFYDLISW